MTNTTPPAPKTRRRHTVITPQMTQLRTLSAHWNALTGPQKSGWHALARLTADATGTPLTRRSALSTFLSVNAAQSAAGAPILSDAPSAPVAPAALPPLLLTATFDPATKAFALTLTAAAYPNPVIINAARPRLVGQDAFATTPFKRIGALPSLGGTSDLTAMFQSAYHVPGSGYQILLRLVAVSPTGQRAVPVERTIPITPLAQAIACETDTPDTLELQQTA